MIVLGLDAAARTGFALVEKTVGPERLIEHGSVDTGTADIIQTFATNMATRRRAPDIVVIEDCYLDKNVQTLKALARLTGRWQQAFESMGLRTRLCMADVWQKRMLGQMGGAGRASRKKAAMTWCRAWFKAELDPDAADAACMAAWECRRSLLPQA